MPLWDPLHEQVGPRSAWTRVNISEAIPGVPTPLTWSFWFPVQELGILGAWHDLGVVAGSEVRIGARPEDRLGAIFYGRPAANLDLMKRMADRIPGTSGGALEHQLLGSLRSDPASGVTRARYPVIALKLPYTLWRLPARLRRLRAEIDPWWRNATGAEASTDEEDLARDLRAAHAQFLRVMRPHAAASNIAQVCFEQVRRLAAAADRPGLEATLVSGYGGLEETAELRRLWSVAHGSAPLTDFLRDYGFHSPSEGELSSRSWREDPTPLGVILRGLGDREESEGPAAAEKRQRERRADAEAELVAALPESRRPATRIVLAAARRYVPQREHGKASFLRVLDVARRAARERGKRLAERGLLDDPEDAFHLTLEELVAAEPPADARERAAERKVRRREYLELDLPDAWVGMPSPRPRGETLGSRDEPIRALGVSPGVVEGAVRVVADLGPDTEFDPGEILVCATTDPSWASVLLIASAAVIDVGGPLSHGAIVARELGIPCVIQARDASRRLRTGDRIRVDGTSGIVVFLSGGARDR